MKKNRILGAMLLAGAVLAPAATFAADVCKYTELLRLPLLRNPYTALQGVTGEVNGFPVKFLVDTGASFTMLLHEQTKHLDLPLLQASGSVIGVGGRVTRFTAEAKEVAIGPVRMRKVTVPVLEGMEKSSFQAIAGANFLLRAEFEFALRDGHIKFFSAAGCDNTHLAYWDADAMSVPLVDMARGDRPKVEVELDGRKVVALIDTGAALSVVNQELAERLGHKRAAEQPAMKLSGIGESARQGWIDTFDTFRIGDETVQRPVLTVMESRTGDRLEHDMILGLDFLRAHRVLFSPSQKRFYFSYLGTPIFINPPKQAMK